MLALGTAGRACRSSPSVAGCRQRLGQTCPPCIWGRNGNRERSMQCIIISPYSRAAARQPTKGDQGEAVGRQRKHLPRRRRMEGAQDDDGRDQEVDCEPRHHVEHASSAWIGTRHPGSSSRHCLAERDCVRQELSAAGGSVGDGHADRPEDPGARPRPLTDFLPSSWLVCGRWASDATASANLVSEGRSRGGARSSSSHRSRPSPPPGTTR